MTSHGPIAGSFRDPAGQVHTAGDCIFRTVSHYGAPNFKDTLKTGLLDRFVERGDLVPFREVRDPPTLALFPNAAHVLEHPRLAFISHPYEWTFPLLKSAALFHLDLALDCIDNDIVLSDATAYNVQFIGTRPIFMDHLSFRPYVEGEYWTSHRQFCEQFLNPLLLRHCLDLPHNAWFRGTLEGISTQDLLRVLPVSAKLSLRMLLHVVLPGRFQRKATATPGERPTGIADRKPLPRAAYRGMLRQLRDWIADLRPRGDAESLWGSYAKDNSYTGLETSIKTTFIEKFIAERRPELVFDLGCNTGFFSEIALRAGAQRVIGFDFDQAALSGAYQRARDRNLDFLPLYGDAANPSPSQGWHQQERLGLSERARADAVLALAFQHHLAIARNIPLERIVDWIVPMAPEGIIEFVEKNDPTIQTMLAMREDIFANYSRETFESILATQARIVDRCEVMAGSRYLYRYRSHDIP